MAYCSKCGSNISAATFCPQCGTASASAGSPPQYSSPAGSVPPPSPGYQTPPAYATFSAQARQNNIAMWCQLSPLLVGVAGGMLASFAIGFIILVLAWLPPLLIKNSNRGNDFIRDHANEAINFQLFWLIIDASLLVVFGILGIVTLGIGWAILAILIGAISIFQLVVMILATVAASRGLRYRYPMVWFRLVRG